MSLVTIIDSLQWILFTEEETQSRKTICEVVLSYAFLLTMLYPYSIGNIHNQVMVGEARIGAFYVAYALPLALGLCQSQTLRTKSENVMQAEAISHEMVKPIRTWA